MNELKVENNNVPQFFDNITPQAKVEMATTIADALAPIIEKKNLFMEYKGSRHVYIEGWTTLGFLTGVYARIAWTKKIEIPKIKGRKDATAWKARAEAYTCEGKQVGSAEMICSSYEKNFSHQSESAIISMAQTRAISKALRMPLGFIMTLSGYSSTPAEEMSELKNNNSNFKNNEVKKTATEVNDEVHDALNPKGEKVQSSLFNKEEYLKKLKAKYPKLQDQRKNALKDKKTGVLSVEEFFEIKPDLWEHV